MKASDRHRRILLRLFLILGLTMAALSRAEESQHLAMKAKLLTGPEAGAAEPVAKWKFRVFDAETRRQVGARVSISSLKLRGPEKFALLPFRPPLFFAPSGVEVLKPSIDYGFSESTVEFFHTPGESTLDVPKAGFEIWIQKGFEYEAIRENILPNLGETRDFHLKRWMNMPRRGWYSGDTHIHNLEGAGLALQLEAEDVHVGNLLLYRSNYGTPLLGPDVPAGAYPAASTQEHLAWVGEEFRNDTLGHFSMLDLKKFREPMTTHGPDRLDFPPMYVGLQDFRRQNTTILLSHLGAQPGVISEYPVDVALGMVDAVETFLGWGTRRGLEWWYQLLNCGFRVAAASGTDRMGPGRIVGSQRVYVHLEEPFSYAGWVKNLKQGHTFVTNGPMLFLNVDGKPIGEILEITGSSRTTVKVEAQAQSRVPFQWLEIIQDGQVVYRVSSLSPDNLRAEVTLDVPVTRSGWIAARCIGNGEVVFPEIQPRPTLDGFAHTSPVYLILDGERIACRKDAQLLRGHIQLMKKWVHSVYSAPEQAAAFLELLEKADAVYAAIPTYDRQRGF